MDAIDFALAPIYLGIIYFMAMRIISRNSGNKLYAMYYRRGLNYKLFGSLVFALIYTYYYKGGDSVNFYYATKPLFKLLFSDPGEFFYFLFNQNSGYPSAAAYEAGRMSIIYLLKGAPSLTTIRIATVINILAINSYLAGCFLFAFISYHFQWKVFNLLCSVYPGLHKQFFLVFLGIPSVIFWSAGVGKDSIMLGSIMLFFYCFYRLVIHKKQIFKYLLLLLITGYLISLIRGFILFTLLPCCVFMAVTYYRNVIRSSFLRFAAGPVLAITGIGVSVLFIRSLGDAVQSYSIDSLQQKAEGFRSWHAYLGETTGGSAYSLGTDLEYTPLGILRQAPMAIIITLFGPFIWQVRNVVMLLSGIESLVFLYFTFKLFFNKRIYSLFGILFKDHIIVFCIPFILILSIAIGLTSFNYGALVRYKIPILPFFAAALVVINYHLNRSR